MSYPSDHTVVAYDPFGEPVQGSDGGALTLGDRRARSVAVTGFWILALMLIAGRVYFGDQPAAQAIAYAHAQVAALVTAIR